MFFCGETIIFFGKMTGERQDSKGWESLPKWMLVTT
jgi:hypothetical protein